MVKRIVAAALLAAIGAVTTAPQGLADSRKAPCKNCQLRMHYDSREVIRTSRDIDRSRVINTTTVVPVKRKVREHNHLVIRDHRTRYVGTVRHKHTIIEKEVRYRRARPLPPATVINFVVHNYRVVHWPENARAQDCGRCAPVRAKAKPRHRTVLDVRG